MEKIKEQVLKHTGEKRTLLNNILYRKANWIGQILRINFLLHDVIEEKMMEVKGVKRRTEVLDDSRNRKEYWELMEEAEDKKRWK